MFITQFIEYGSTVLYQRYVVNAASDANVKSFQRIFAFAGFDGVTGSSDGTCVGMLQCPSWAGINHKGFKLAIPSINLISVTPYLSHGGTQ